MGTGAGVGGLGIGGGVASVAGPILGAIGQRQAVKASQASLDQERNRQLGFNRDRQEQFMRLGADAPIDLFNSAQVANVDTGINTALAQGGPAGATDAARDAIRRARRSARRDAVTRAGNQQFAQQHQLGGDVGQRARSVSQSAGSSLQNLQGDLDAAGMRGGELRALGTAAQTVGPALLSFDLNRRSTDQILERLKNASPEERQFILDAIAATRR